MSRTASAAPRRIRSTSSVPARLQAQRWDVYNHRDDSDFYTQPGNLFRLMKPEEKERPIGNIAASLSNAPRNIQERQLCHFFRADPAYGEGVAKTLGVPVKELAAAK
jgi:catalase